MILRPTMMAAGAELHAMAMATMASSQAELVSHFQETTDHLIKAAIHSDGDDTDLTQNAALPPKA